MSRRLWRYRYKDYSPRWSRYLLPMHGDDEYGRLTMVLPIHPFGWLVWAYWTCHCPECTETRARTLMLEEEERDRG